MQLGLVWECKKGFVKQGFFVCLGLDFVVQFVFDVVGYVLCCIFGFLGFVFGLKFGIVGCFVDGIFDGVCGFIGCGFGFIGDCVYYYVFF